MKTSVDVLGKEKVNTVQREAVLSSKKGDIRAEENTAIMEEIVDHYDPKLQLGAMNMTAVKKRENNKVNLYSSSITNDKEIASLVSQKLKVNSAVACHDIKVAVKNGWVTLEGVLNGDFQRKAADQAIRHVKGVRGIINKLKIGTEIQGELNKELIEKALRQNWLLEIDNIKVRIDGKTIFLSGIVESVSQKQKAESIAWNTPGVLSVANELLVEFD